MYLLKIESLNSVKHYSLFRPPILKLRAKLLLPYLTKCEIRVNEMQ